MTVSQSAGVSATTSSISLRRFVTWLMPLESGPPTTRALDGLRALAALSVLAYHACLSGGLVHTPFGLATHSYWYYLVTGVELFFVLSGFLLFLPYARAMLHGAPLPSARRFYQRRALRILPAYLVCLAIIAFLPTSVHRTPLSVGNLVAHLLFIHDMFPQYNQDLEGPFWTLAVEVQFYLILPLLAAGIARVVGKTRSRWRLIFCLVAIMAFAVLLRKADGLATGLVSSYSLHGWSISSVALVFILLTYGMQGKFIEIFAIGMLCGVIYIITIEDHALSQRAVRWLGAGITVAAIAVIVFVAIPHDHLAEVMFYPGSTRGWAPSIYPLIMGGAYGGLVLGTLLFGGVLRAIFEFRPLRFVGLISFSLYLWHQPIINRRIPMLSQLPLPLSILAAFVVAYVSYQLVERPFLVRRHQAGSQSKPSIDIRMVPVYSGAGVDVANLQAQPIRKFQVEGSDSTVDPHSRLTSEHKSTLPE